MYSPFYRTYPMCISIALEVRYHEIYEIIIKTVISRFVIVCINMNSMDCKFLLIVFLNSVVF